MARPGNHLEGILVISPADQIALAKDLKRTQPPTVALLRCNIRISTGRDSGFGIPIGVLALVLLELLAPRRRNW